VLTRLGQGFPWWLSGKKKKKKKKNLPTSAGDTGIQVQSLDWDFSLEKEMATCSSIFACKTGKRSLEG